MYKAAVVNVEADTFRLVAWGILQDTLLFFITVVGFKDSVTGSG